MSASPVAPPPAGHETTPELEASTDNAAVRLARIIVLVGLWLTLMAEAVVRAW